MDKDTLTGYIRILKLAALITAPFVAGFFFAVIATWNEAHQDVLNSVKGYITPFVWLFIIELLLLGVLYFRRGNAKNDTANN